MYTQERGDVMVIFLTLTTAVLFFLLGIYLFLAGEFKEPTLGKAYWARFYEKVKAEEENKLLVFRKLTDRSQFGLAWFFFSAGLLMVDLMLL